MRNRDKAKKKKVNSGFISSKNLDDKSTNNSESNEKVDSNGFEWSPQKVKYWFNLIELTLILDKWLRSEIHERNHDLGEDSLALNFIRKYMRLLKKKFQINEGEVLILTKFHHILHA